MALDIDELHRAASPLQGARSGVYFLFAGEELVYVGEGWNCLLRVAEHTRKESTKSFLSWNFLPVDDRYERKALERQLRHQYKPRFNRR